MTVFTLWYEDFPIQAVIAGIVGLLWGLASDRLAARWPAHEDGSVRAVDWRTPVVAVVGAAAFAGTVLRFGSTPIPFVLVGVYVAALVVLFATDLDQRLLPDLITLPTIPLALVVFATGQSPFVHTIDDFAWAVGGAIAVPLALYLLAIPFGRGAIGQGDLKLLGGVGLFAGSAKLFYGLVAGALIAGITVTLLLVTRRIAMKSFIPYGPFLILGILWSILALSQP